MNRDAGVSGQFLQTPIAEHSWIMQGQHDFSLLRLQLPARTVIVERLDAGVLNRGSHAGRFHNISVTHVAPAASS